MVRRKIFICAIVMLVSVVVAFAQDVPSNIMGHRLPYTWEAPMMGGKMICTMHEDGRITSQMVTQCFNCGGIGGCRVCGGTGGQYWYQIGIMPCGACGGTGRCRACGGKGYSVISTTTTQSGLTTGYDEYGNYYVAGGGPSGGSGSNRSGDSVYHCCDKVTNFGQDLYHKCRNCGEVHRIGTHSCLK